jgi:hypothetical protein
MRGSEEPIPERQKERVSQRAYCGVEVFEDQHKHFHRTDHKALSRAPGNGKIKSLGYREGWCLPLWVSRAVR